MKMITIVAAIRTTGQISVSGPMSSDIQGLLITIHWHGGDPFLCDPLFFNVSLWQCLANASQA
jgi:sulfatase maturation enzyme AslB (radical SAM superfamily)